MGKRKVFDPKTATYKIEKTKYKGGKWINSNTPVNTEGEPSIGTLQLGQDGQFWIFAEQEKQKALKMKKSISGDKADNFLFNKPRKYKGDTKPKDMELNFMATPHWEYLAKVWGDETADYLPKVTHRDLRNPWRNTLDGEGKKMDKDFRFTHKREDNGGLEKAKISAEAPFINYWKFNKNKNYNPKTGKAYRGKAKKGQAAYYEQENTLVGVGYEEADLSNYKGTKWVKGKAGFARGKKWSKLMRFIFLTYKPKFDYDAYQSPDQPTGLGYDTSGKDLMPLGIPIVRHATHSDKGVVGKSVRDDRVVAMFDAKTGLQSSSYMQADMSQSSRSLNQRAQEAGIAEISRSNVPWKFNRKKWKPRLYSERSPAHQQNWKDKPEADPKNYSGVRKKDIELLLEARDLLEERQGLLDKMADKAEKSTGKKKGTWVRIYASGGKGYIEPTEKQEVLLPPFIGLQLKAIEKEKWAGQPWGEKEEDYQTSGRKWKKRKVTVPRRTMKDVYENRLDRANKTLKGFNRRRAEFDSLYKISPEVMHLLHLKANEPEFYKDNVEAKIVKIEDLPKEFRDEWYTTKPQPDPTYLISTLDRAKGKLIDSDGRKGGKIYWNFGHLPRPKIADINADWESRQKYMIEDANGNDITDESWRKSGKVTRDFDETRQTNANYGNPVENYYYREAMGTVNKNFDDLEKRVFKYKDKLPAGLQWHLSQDDIATGNKTNWRKATKTQNPPRFKNCHTGYKSSDNRGEFYHPNKYGNPLKLKGKELIANTKESGGAVAIKRNGKGVMVGADEPGKWYCQHTGLELEEVKEKPGVYWLRTDKYGAEPKKHARTEDKEYDTYSASDAKEYDQAYLSGRKSPNLFQLHPSGPQTHFEGYSVKMSIPEKNWETKRTEKYWENQINAGFKKEEVESGSSHIYNEKARASLMKKKMTLKQRQLAMSTPTKKGDLIDLLWMKKKSERLYVAERKRVLQRPEFSKSPSYEKPYRKDSGKMRWEHDNEKRLSGEVLDSSMPRVDWSEEKSFAYPPKKSANMELKYGVGSGYIKRRIKGIFPPDALEMKSKKMFGYTDIDDKMKGRIDSLRSEIDVPSVKDDTWQLLYARKTASTPPIKIWLSFEEGYEHPWKRGLHYVKEDDLAYRTDSLGAGAYPYGTVQGGTANFNTRRGSRKQGTEDVKGGNKRRARPIVWNKGTKSPAGSLLENIIKSGDKMHIYKVDINDVILDSGGYESVKNNTVAKYLASKKKKLNIEAFGARKKPIERASRASDQYSQSQSLSGVKLF